MSAKASNMRERKRERESPSNCTRQLFYEKAGQKERSHYRSESESCASVERIASDRIGSDPFQFQFVAITSQRRLVAHIVTFVSLSTLRRNNSKVYSIYHLQRQRSGRHIQAQKPTQRAAAVAKVKGTKSNGMQRVRRFSLLQRVC